MNQSKYDQMVREFPFLTKIFAESNHDARTIDTIRVVRGDKNLLDVTPHARLFEERQRVRSHYRWFWTVTEAREIKDLPRAWQHMVGNKVRERTAVPCIGVHIAASRNDVDYVVEMSQVQADGYDHPLVVTVYKMLAFNVLDDPHRYIRNCYAGEIAPSGDAYLEELRHVRKSHQ